MNSIHEVFGWETCSSSAVLVSISASPGLDDSVHDFFLGCVGNVEFGDQGTLIHHVDPVAHAEQLRHLGGYHENTLAPIGQPVDDRIDFVFRTYVDATSGLVENEDLRV